MCQCLIFIDRPQGVAEILEKLVKSSSEDSILMGYQIAFDMYESATQQFLQRVQVRGAASFDRETAITVYHKNKVKVPVKQRNTQTQCVISTRSFNN